MTQGDEPKQFITNYLGAQNNIQLLNKSAAGIGSMSIGNNEAIVRQLPTFERVENQLVPSLALEMTRVAVGASTFKLSPQMPQAKKRLALKLESITSN